MPEPKKRTSKKASESLESIEVTPPVSTADETSPVETNPPKPSAEAWWIKWVGWALAIIALIPAGSTAVYHWQNQARTIANEKARRAHELHQILLYDLDQAERNACAARSNPNGSHAFTLSLESAASIEPECRELCEVGVYHALADLGSSIWDFPQIKQFCERAIEKCDTPWDKQLSLQQLGSAHFDFYESPVVNEAKLETARACFNEAIDVLRKTSQELRAAKAIGQAYELLAAHEMYHGHEAEAERNADLAKSEWKKLPLREQSVLITELEEHLKTSKEGTHPRSPCRVSTLSPDSLQTARLSLPALSRDRSLGRIIEGKLHLEYVDLVPINHVITAQDEAGTEFEYTEISYGRDIKTIVVEPTATIPLRRYIPYIGVSSGAKEGTPTVAPPVPN